jgi:hypothetical protein
VQVCRSPRGDIRPSAAVPCPFPIPSTPTRVFFCFPPPPEKRRDRGGPPPVNLLCTRTRVRACGRGCAPGTSEAAGTLNSNCGTSGRLELLTGAGELSRIRFSPWVVSLRPSLALVCRSPSWSHLWHCVGRHNWGISGPSTGFGRTPAVNHRHSGRRRRTDRGEGRDTSSLSDRAPTVAIEPDAYRFG